MRIAGMWYNTNVCEAMLETTRFEKMTWQDSNLQSLVLKTNALSIGPQGQMFAGGRRTRFQIEGLLGNPLFCFCTRYQGAWHLVPGAKFIVGPSAQILLLPSFVSVCGN